MKHKKILIIILFLFLMSIIEFFFLFRCNYSKCQDENNEYFTLNFNGIHEIKNQFPVVNPYNIEIYDDSGRLIKDEDIVNRNIWEIPSRDFVPDYKTAIRLAITIWTPIYGKKIYEEQPFNTILVNDSIWIVTGSLSKNTIGGTAYIEINKQTGKIIKSTHYK